MATPGDPFDTEDMEAQRSRQRRRLRDLTDWYLDEAQKAMTALPGVPEFDRAMLERELRRMADEALAEASDFLDQLGTWVRRSAVATLVGQISAPRPGQPDYFDEFRLGQGREPQLPPGVDGNGIIRGICFLIWADALAADNYTDPRLPF